VDISTDAYIPETYIENLAQRIDAYRKIASIVTEADSSDVIDELVDRYGEPPKSVMGLINVALMRNSASAMGIKEIKQAGDRVLFYIRSIDPEQIQNLLAKYKNRVKFFDSDKPYFHVVLDKKQKANELMNEVIKTMQI
jgi:transcription-repair coupling factor (superfamily II helicase)